MEKTMAILILNKSAMSFSAYHTWFGKQLKDELYYFSAPGKRDLNPKEQFIADQHYSEINEYSNYEYADSVERDAFDLHERIGVTAVVALSEWDQIRAGRLRERFGLSGTKEDVALRYRDKYEMKKWLKSAGVTVTEFVSVNNTLELVNFIDKVGYPVVVKPRLLADSSGVNILGNTADLQKFVVTGFGTCMEEQYLLIAEKMVNIRHEYHIDGIIVDGKIRLNWPSMYIGEQVGQIGSPLSAGALLTPDHPQRIALQNLIEQTLIALPKLENSTFHAEAFENEHGELLLNEIGARTGGNRINDEIKAAFGLWLNKEWARDMANLPCEIKDSQTVESLPKVLAGYVMFRPKPGRLLSIPQECPFEGVFDYRTNAEPGTVFGQWKDSSDNIGSVVATADTYEQLTDKLSDICTWFHATTQYETIHITADK